ncbi:hypothetical protein Dimus_007880 [Dionaea muscipula]
MELQQHYRKVLRIGERLGNGSLLLLLCLGYSSTATFQLKIKQVDIGFKGFNDDINGFTNDKYLLYYSSIDLRGPMAMGKLDRPKLRSLSADDSPSKRSRLRLPMKGRIQLVTAYISDFF